MTHRADKGSVGPLRRSFAVALLLSLALIVPAGANPPPSAVTVDVLEDFFLPSIVPLARGGTVTWDFSGAGASHTATDDTGMGLYDSDIVRPGGPDFSYTFAAAGDYAVVCTLHVGMDGRVEVPVRAAPPKGSMSSDFTITWSKALAATGFVFDVMVKRKGRTWQTWQDGVTIRQAGFGPDSPGTYFFRARLRHESTGAHSGWSGSAKIIVN